MATTKFQVSPDIFATVPQRFLNYIIDAIMQAILMIIIALVSLTIAESVGNKSVFNFIEKIDKNTIGIYTVSFAVTLLYYNVFEIFTARTVGKFITQTIVVDEHGEIPHHEVILIRSLCRLIPFYPLSVLIFGRGWHDTISKTYVVDKRLLDENKRKFYSLQQTSDEA